MVLCGTKDGSSGIAVKNLLSTFNFKSVDSKSNYSSNFVTLIAKYIILDYFSLH